jgi:hypothetical protein
VEEGIDYKIDYLNGILYQLKTWDASSPARCNYEYMDEIILSAGGAITAQSTGQVKQLSFWVPEVQVDRFTLWYNYGTLVNRFAASSEEYKSFLRGIMHLYVEGPVLERIESALNVAAGYPVVKVDGEILQAYDNGINASGVAAVLISASDTVVIPPAEHLLSELDTGGYLVIESALNANNIGRFRILDIDAAMNTAILETQYGFTDEVGLSWSISREFLKKVTTDKRTYSFPYYVPIRTDIALSSSIGILTFKAFEPLTTGFTVTDYVEDPEWWHNRHIPPVLWASEPTSRRIASTKLYAHVIGAEDDPCIGDPGLYIGATEDGLVFTPNDNSGGPGVGDPVPIYRHKVAFTLFDRFFKCHMFFVEIDAGLELGEQFRTDLEELILVAKPSYTYPYVEPNAVFVDNFTLTDILAFGRIIFSFGGDADGHSDAIHIANNDLIVGDPSFPWTIGDFYRYEKYLLIPIPGAPVGAPVAGTSFILTVPVNERPYMISFNGTVGGSLILEGRDYTVNWLYEDPPGVPNPNAWRVTLLTTWDGLVFPTMNMRTVVLTGAASYDATLGDTPFFVGGLNATYIRTGALDPNSPTFVADWAAVRTEQIDRALQITIVDTLGPYTY